MVQDEEGSEAEGEEEDEKITRNWSVLKSNPELSKSKVTSFLWIIDLFGFISDPMDQFVDTIERVIDFVIYCYAIYLLNNLVFLHV